MPQAGDQPGDVLHVEEAIRWFGSAGIARAAPVAGREWPFEAAGSGPDAGSAEDCLKKAVKPRQKRRLVRWTQKAYQISERRAARVMDIAVSTVRSCAIVVSGHCRKCCAVGCESWRRRMCYGYRRLTVLLRREGWKVNAKRVFSVIDSFTKQCHALEVDSSFPSRRVTRVLGSGHRTVRKTSRDML